tara:strand:- start:322 stop:618 length:297 start_codon:yes stop_codon:yes gene_type:complete
MRNLLVLIFAAVVLFSCQASEQQSFRKMTEEELIAYNANVPLEQNVFCFEDVRTGSFIKKIRCMTLYDIITEVEDNTFYLDMLNYDHSPYVPTHFGND